MKYEIDRNTIVRCGSLPGIGIYVM